VRWGVDAFAGGFWMYGRVVMAMGNVAACLVLQDAGGHGDRVTRLDEFLGPVLDVDGF
jgi:hypothetical protein